MPSAGWNITGPYLTDAEAEQATSAGGFGGILEPTEYQRAILLGLQLKPHVYGGTVDPETVAARRRRNKTARKSRRTNRGRR